MTQGNLVKEFHKLLKNVKKISDGQASISEWDDENVATFKIEIQPHSGAYKGGKFSFKVTLGEEFPKEPPHIRCETPVYHPNIDPTEECDETNICLNMFTTDEWQEAYGVDGVVQGLLFLFYEPNLEDPLSPYFDGSTPHEDFIQNVLLSLKGEEVEGVQFARNYDEDEEEDTNVKTETVEDECNETKNDNSSGKSDDSNSDNVPKEDNLENTLDAKEVLDKNNPDFLNSDTDLKEEEKFDNCVQDPSKGSTLGITLKPKEHSVQASVIAPTDTDRPDVIPLSNDDCSASCPDIVSMTTDRSRQPRETSKDLKIASARRETIRQSVSWQSFDAVLPEMNIVFAVLNKVTETIKT